MSDTDETRFDIDKALTNFSLASGSFSRAVLRHSDIDARDCVWECERIRATIIAEFRRLERAAGEFNEGTT